MINMNNFAGYRIKELANWTTFKTVDMNIQQSFIKTLSDEFNANTSDISHMFSIDRNVIDAYFKKYKFRPYLGRSHDEIKRKKWNDFLQLLKIKRRENKLETLAEQISHGELTFNGVSDEILVNIAILCKGKNVTINVKW